MMKPGYIDSHSHLADPRLEAEVGAMLQRAKNRGIEYFLQGGVGPEDWQRQKDLQRKHSEIWLCFGLHPYWVAEHSLDECEMALDQLSREMGKPEVLALGEMGLDLRPHIMKDSFGRQLEIFENQLELAEMAHKPIVLHLVQAFAEAEKIFEIHGLPKCGGLVHSFNGSVKEAQRYLDFDLHLSIGGPVVRGDNQRLHQAVKEIPLSHLLLETDSPDQPPPRLKGTQNEPESLWDVAEMIGKLRQLPPEEILDISSRNLRKLLSNGNQSQL